MENDGEQEEAKVDKQQAGREPVSPQTALSSNTNHHDTHFRNRVRTAGSGEAGTNDSSGTPDSDSMSEQSKERDGDGGGLAENQGPRLPNRPKAPSKQEREEHEATGHACYRSWCEHCVAARGRGQYHRGGSGEGEIPELAFDYGYMSKDDAKCLPIICCRHRGFSHHAGTFVESKGRNDYTVQFIVQWI